MTKSWFDTIRHEMNIRIQDGFPQFEDHVHVHEVREPGLIFQDERVKVTSADRSSPSYHAGLRLPASMVRTDPSYFQEIPDKKQRM